MEDTSSLFTEWERHKYQRAEKILVSGGDFNLLLNFWADKRNLFLQRAIERIQNFAVAIKC